MIETELKIHLEAKLLEINKIIGKEYGSVHDIGVLAGTSGLALFKFYYARYTGNKEEEDKGEEILTEAFNKINNDYARPTFCVGIAGAGWAIEHLIAEDFVEMESDDLLEVLDVYLYQMMGLEADPFYFDFLHGALGIAFYFLSRYENTNSEELKSRYGSYLQKVIDTLERTAILEGSTAKWRSIIDREKKTPGYNFSLSHGMSSIINFLSRLTDVNEVQPKAESLLAKAVNYIVSNENIDPEKKHYFPDFIHEDNTVQQGGRLAW
ncbi:MAG: lanthionine synthetase LanC family protein, partial [Cyclobacteriaceae bacterium]